MPGDLGFTELAEWWGRGAHFEVTPLPGDATNWFGTIPEQRFDNTASGLEHLRAVFASLPADVQRVLAAAAPEQTLINSIWVSRPLRSVVPDA